MLDWESQSKEIIPSGKTTFILEKILSFKKDVIVTSKLWTGKKPSWIKKTDGFFCIKISKEKVEHGKYRAPINHATKTAIATTLIQAFSISSKKYFAEKGYEPAFGARPMRRLIQKELEDNIANLILDGTANQKDTITVEVKNQKVIVAVKKNLPKEVETVFTEELLIKDKILV